MRLSRVVRMAAVGVSDAQIQAFSNYKINPMKLKDVAEFGSKTHRDRYLSSCKFIRNECAIRLAHIIQEVRELPPAYLKEENIQQISAWYTTSFEELVAIREPKATATVEEEDAFAEMIRRSANAITQRHTPTVMTMAVAMQRLLNKGTVVDKTGTIEFLDRLFMARIGTRFLLTQHMSTFEAPQDDTLSSTTGSRWVGSIDRETDVPAIAKHAAEAARMLCYDMYCDAPEVEIETTGALDRPFMYIPSHIYHIFFELLKNSCRAVTEFHDGAAKLPPIKILICVGDEDISIRISDLGGGISRRVEVDHLFTYMYSTAATPEFFERAVNGDNTALTDMNNAPLAGFGYGLPISRLYARYLGGELSLECMEGHGTDAYVYLQALADRAEEVLPSFEPSQVTYASKLDRVMAPHWLEGR
eukprot:m.25995 g.25995  ORF g.25995 m.25995 type:complete len:417 (-) comp11623_c0_seq1:1447-2697(-)